MASSTLPENDALKNLQREFIKELFETDFSIPVQDIKTLPRCNNNFVHFVTFASAVDADRNISDKPGTYAIPEGTTQAVFRIGNPASTFNHAVRVENTVAVMQIASRALSKLNIVPRVFAWSKTGGPSNNGWIIEQHMPGVDLESEFHTKLSRDSQRHILRQVAQILKAIQDFKLPPKASNFGGLSFDGEGEVVSGPYVIEPYTGPYPDMKIFYKDMLDEQLKESDRSPVAKGWRESGLRQRLDAFAEKGLEDVLSKTLSKGVEPCLIIGDVVIANFLIHPETYEILGLVDYDCSHTGHPIHEYFFSSFSVNYFLLDSQPEVIQALLHGYPSPLPVSIAPNSSEPGEPDPPQWEVMQLFEEELKKVDAARPSSIEGAEAITDLYGLLAEVCPFHFCMDRWIKRQTEEKLKSAAKKQEETIEKVLAKLLA